MPEFKPPRPGEQRIDLPTNSDAELYFIGRIRSAYPMPANCPKNTLERSDPATIVVDPPYDQGLAGIEGFSHVIALYWLDQSRRDLIVQHPSHRPEPAGVFSLRSPVRPNPIGLAVVEIMGREGNKIRIRSIDCADGTPLLDLKPYLASSDAVPGARRPKKHGSVKRLGTAAQMWRQRPSSIFQQSFNSLPSGGLRRIKTHENSLIAFFCSASFECSGQ